MVVQVLRQVARSQTSRPFESNSADRQKGSLCRRMIVTRAGGGFGRSLGRGGAKSARALVARCRSVDRSCASHTQRTETPRAHDRVGSRSCIALNSFIAFAQCDKVPVAGCLQAVAVDQRCARGSIFFHANDSMDVECDNYCRHPPLRDTIRHFRNRLRTEQGEFSRSPIHGEISVEPEPIWRIDRIDGR